MKIIEFDKNKSQKLLAERGICFEDIIPLIQSGDIVKDLPHPNAKKFPHQRIIYLEHKNYIHAVPYVEDSEKIFLKTIFATRKVRKQLEKDNEEEK
jgi:uncharacterized DUF497 family protein